MFRAMLGFSLLCMAAACAAPQAGPASAQAAASATPREREAERYSRQEFELIKAQLHYPTLAYERLEQGTVRVAYTLSNDGTLREAHIVKSSGSALLDQETLIAIHRVKRFDPVPGALQHGDDDVRMELSIEIGLMGPTGGPLEP